MRNRKRTAPFRPNLPAEGKGGRRESKRCGSEAQITARASRPALWTENRSAARRDQGVLSEQCRIC